MHSSEKKTALVTGGSSGIGKAIALELLKDGFDLIVHYNKSRAGAEEVRAAADKMQQKVLIAQADFTKREEIDSLANIVSESTDKMNVIVHAAGINEKQSFDRVSHETLDDVFSVNIKAPILLTQKILPLLKAASPNASVLFIGSSYAFIGGSDESVLYSASKAALSGFTRTLAKAHIVRANVVAPGYIDTPLLHRQRSQEDTNKKIDSIPTGRLGTPQEIAALCRFLCSNNAQYITGQTIHQNGGTFFS